MDITGLFQATLTSVRKRHPAFARSEATKTAPKTACPTAPEAPQPSSASEFTQKTQHIRAQLTELRDLLVENRSAYMRFGQHLKSAQQMSDAQRDIIDTQSEQILSVCSQFVTDLRSAECAGRRRSRAHRQNAEHRDAVLESLSDYMRAVHQIYAQQKAYRVKHELETYRLLKLESDKKLIPVVPGRDRRPPALLTSEGESVDGDEDEDGSDGHPERSDDDASDYEHEIAVADERPKAKAQRASSTKITTTRSESEGDEFARPATAATSSPYRSYDEDSGAMRFELDADELSADDVQMFESENHQLYNELKGLSDEVEQIEQNVVDIARLQDIFTEKVSMQETDIARIAETVVSATENVKDANEQIKQAIQRNAGLRVYILFFLLVMSFSLLFLDWYND